jgi:hypothetical protein
VAILAIDLGILGDSGLKRSGGRVYEEELRRLSGIRAVRVYSEMKDNDAVIGSILFAIEMLCRQVEWRIQEASDNKADVEAAQFVTECMDDMSHTWPDLISEILTMLPYGWSYFEICYKYRHGESNDPTHRSKYNDGRVGWRKIPLRSQESLYEWDWQPDGGIRAMIQQVIYGENTGIKKLPIEKSLLFRTKSDKNNPEGRSILRNSFRSWYMKKRIEEIEAIGIERDLAGLPVMEVPPEIMNASASDDQKALLAELKIIVSEIRRDEREGLIIPAEIGDDGVQTGYKFRLLSTGGTRQFDTNKTITRYEQRIAMTVLAEFIMLGLDKVGSFSLVSSKMNLFGTALDAWLDSIEAVFNRYAIPRLLKANGLKLESLPQLRHGPVQDLSIEELGVFLEKLGRAGFPIVGDDLENHLRRKANLPMKETEEPM